MIPRLYARSGVINDYLLNNGLGFISTCTECRVTEERNGNYYLDMTVPKSDRLAGAVAPDMIVKAKPNLTDPPQLFEINNIKTNRDSLTVKANHIKNLLYRNCLRSDYTPSSQNPAQTMIDGTPQEIVSRYLSYLAVSGRQERLKARRISQSCWASCSLTVWEGFCTILAASITTIISISSFCKVAVLQQRIR